jgi:hypothetical protein
MAMLVLTPMVWPEDLFQNLPPGVFLQKRVEVPASQLEAFGRKLGGGVQGITNAYLRVNGRAIQVNVITADSEASAKAIHETLSKTKAAPFSLRHDRLVIEYVGKDIDAAVATKTSYELGLLPKPSRVRYRVTADLATIDRADYAACNPLFNKFLALRGGDDAQIVAEIDALAKRFVFGRTLVLRNPKLNDTASVYRFEPAPERTEDIGAVARYVYPPPPVRHGVPDVKAILEITTDASGVSARAAPQGAALTAPTAAWPVADPKIQALAKEITRGQTTNETKVAAILAWLTPGRNLRYTGDVGSRWGTLKVMEQKFGHCWDFSDCFVTLARAAGVPCRQVAGWLYGTSGHVWAEYYREGKGWQQVDPTGGGGFTCGIYHIAYFTSEDGEMPIVYLSMPQIEIEESRQP